MLARPGDLHSAHERRFDVRADGELGRAQSPRVAPEQVEREPANAIRIDRRGAYERREVGADRYVVPSVHEGGGSGGGRWFWPQ